MQQNSASLTTSYTLKSKLKDFNQLVKLRLTLMVVFSTGIGFMMFTSQNFQIDLFLILLFSGFLITGAANGINQIIERDLDKLMTRTQNRPIAQGRISLTEAVILVGVMSFVGVFLLGKYINSISAIIGAISLFVYAFLYTPLKQKTSLSVWIGAVAGAAPPLIGYTAASGSVDNTAWILFAIQFVWQLPHFWALAWVLNDEYNKAGFYLLPFKSGRTKSSAIFTFIAATTLIPVIIVAYFLNITNLFLGFLMLLMTLHFVLQSYRLYHTLGMKEARQLMFGSFYYLPVIQLLLIISHYLK